MLCPVPRAPVLRVEPFADRVAEVLRPPFRDLGEVPHGKLAKKKAKLAGVALKSQTGRTLRLQPPKFRLLTEVSPDGVRFPDPPEAFQEELLCQAQELQCGHEGLLLDLSRLEAPIRPDDPADDPDFISRMQGALPQLPKPPVAGPPPTYHDMEQAIKKGSPATSLNEVPRPLLSVLSGFGLRVLVGVLEDLAWRTSSRLLSAVLHLCLA